MAEHEDEDGRGSLRGGVTAAVLAARRDGSAQVRLDGSRDSMIATVADLTRQDLDVVVRVTGLTADALADHARAICDFAVDVRVPVQFHHRGRLLELAVR